MEDEEREECFSECSSSGLVECSDEDEDAVMVVDDRGDTPARPRVGSYAASTDCSEHGEGDDELEDVMVVSWESVAMKEHGDVAAKDGEQEEVETLEGGVESALENGAVCFEPLSGAGVKQEEQGAKEGSEGSEGGVKQTALMSQPIRFDWEYC